MGGGSVGPGAVAAGGAFSAAQAFFSADTIPITALGISFTYPEVNGSGGRLILDNVYPSDTASETSGA